MTARELVRWALASSITAIGLVMLSRVSAAPVPARRSDSSRLRLSWSARPERIEVCRTLSAEELAEREEHMRQRVECDGRFATYELRVEADGRALHQSTVRGAGLRHDRPLYLLREIDIAPGLHRLRVSFVRRETTRRDSSAVTPTTLSGPDTGLFAGRAQREADERVRRAGAAIPPQLTLDTTVTFASGAVLLVSLDQERRTLRLLNGRP